MKSKQRSLYNYRYNSIRISIWIQDPRIFRKTGQPTDLSKHYKASIYKAALSV